MRLSPLESRRSRGEASARSKGALLTSVGMVLALILGLFAAPLSAQSDGSTSTEVGFEVLQVDVRDANGTIVVRPELGAESGELTVEIEGEQIVTSAAPISRSPVQSNTIIVIDDSETADQIAGFGTIRTAALAFVDGLSADTRVMLVRAGGGRVETTVEVAFTTDHGAIRAAINGLNLSLIHI